MRLGKVIGTVVATQKDKKLVGWKLLMVQELTTNAQPTDNYVVAIDTVGAGIGEIVLTVAGSSARMADRVERVPVDASIIAIVDTVECEGKKVTF